MLLEEQGLKSNLSLRGIKIAKVINNLDPKSQERIKVRVLGVHNINNDASTNSVWAHHCSPLRSASGDLPEAGEFVYVMFPNEDDPMSIIWLGYAKSTQQPDKPDAKSDVTEDADLDFYDIDVNASTFSDDETDT
jgi:hypothetical protein